MNAWFRFSSFVFKVLILSCLFLAGTFVGETIKLPFANWKAIATIVAIFTAIVTAVWFVGNFSTSILEEDEEEQEEFEETIQQEEKYE